MLSSALLTASRSTSRHAFTSMKMLQASNPTRHLMKSNARLSKPMFSSAATSSVKTKTATSAKTAVEGMKTVGSSEKAKILGMTRRELFAGSLVGVLVAQSFFGSASDFYEYRFVVKEGIDPDDLASFYGCDEFMEIFSMFPIISNMMMRGGTFDDRGVVHTLGFPGELLVSMAFTDEMNEENGHVDWFNKRERFKDVFLGYKMWDFVSNFGFHTLDDGRLEVYHHGEYFVGRLPVISLLVKVIFQVHARWVAWATEHHLNHRAFKSETDEEEEIEELSRKNHMLYMLKYHFWTDMKAMLGFGKATSSDEKNEASFLSLGEDDDEIKKVLPIKHKMSLRKVHDSLEDDKDFDLHESGVLESAESSDNAYQMARKVALKRHNTLRVQRRQTALPEN